MLRWDGWILREERPDAATNSQSTTQAVGTEHGDG